MKISILNLSKAKVLMALYNESKMQGNSFLGGNGSKMTLAEAEEHLKNQTYFDYLNGKVMKVELSGDVLDLWLYDRDNGSEAGFKAIQSVYPEADIEIDLGESEVGKVHVIENNSSGNITVRANGFKKCDVKQMEGRISHRQNFKKAKTKKKPQPKIEYRKGFFLVDGKVHKETKRKMGTRIIKKIIVQDLVKNATNTN